MVDEIKYYDSCEISRYTGEVDENGDEIRTLIYEGDAQLQVAYATSNRYDGFAFEHEPLLFIPSNTAKLKTNDYVKVVTINGRTLEYTVQNYEPIKHDWYAELNNTCIWLKDGKEIEG